VADAIGEKNVAIRLSPFGIYNDMNDDSRWETWSYLCEKIRLNFPKISYVHFVEAKNEELVANEVSQKGWGDTTKVDISGFMEILGDIPVISAGLWNAESVWGVVENGRADGCVLARYFVSNPDLVER
jgi:2,4-dienoyl-CoA reductase-like NADH-dependent reductase (Old Yellow Enzyme family)